MCGASDARLAVKVMFHQSLNKASLLGRPVENVHAYSAAIRSQVAFVKTRCDEVALYQWQVLSVEDELTTIG